MHAVPLPGWLFLWMAPPYVLVTLTAQKKDIGHFQSLHHILLDMFVCAKLSVLKDTFKGGTMKNVREMSFKELDAYLIELDSKPILERIRIKNEMKKELQKDLIQQSHPRKSSR